MKITDDQQKQLEQIADKFGLALIMLFGSQKEETAHESSDIDIAVMPASPNASQGGSARESRFGIEDHLRLILALQDVFDKENIDVVNLDETGPLISYHALVGGKALVDRDTFLRAERHFQAIGEYEDTKHFREANFEAIKRRLGIVASD